MQRDSILDSFSAFSNKKIDSEFFKQMDGFLIAGHILLVYIYIYILLEKWFPLHGERAHSLYFCIYIRRLEVSKNNRNVKEEETEQTY